MARSRRRAESSRSRPSHRNHIGQTSANSNGFAPSKQYTFTCPLCGSGTADVTLKPPGSEPPRFFIGCFKCQAAGVRGGAYLRALAEAVGADGGAVLMDRPHAYLHTIGVPSSPAEPPPSLAQIEGWHARLLTRDGESALAYLMDRRGLTLDVIEEARIGWDGKRLRFPFFRHGEPVAYKKRLPRDGAKMRNCTGRGRNWPLYPEPEPDWPWALLVAGELDALRGRSVGLPATSVPLGGGTWRDEWLDSLRGVRRAVVLFDNGEEHPARKVVQRLRAAAIPARRLSLGRLGLTEPGADLSDYLDMTNDNTSALLRAARRGANR